IWSCMQRVVPGDGPVAIGTPVANTQTYVLDGELDPVPRTVAGDLYLAGDGLARGYWRDPARTASEFVPNPFREGERMYRTGDRARLSRDGALEFLGRVDSQIKLRGHRIELGEVEAAIRRHPAVALAAVTLWGTDPLEQKLVAHYTSEPGLARPSPSDLRDFVGAVLPDSMVPSDFVELAAFPLTATNKLDRKRLPAPTPVADRDESSWPESAAEVELLQIAADLFGHPAARSRSFFDGGGNSLMATRLAARIQKKWNIEISLRAIFESRTLAALARAIEQKAGLPGPPVEILTAPRDGQLLLSYAQERLWFLDRYAPGEPVYNLNIALDIEGPLDLAALRASLDALCLRHEALRTNFVWVDERPVQAIRDNVTVPFELRNVEDPAGGEIDRLIRAEVRRPFDLAHDVLLRALALPAGAERHTLVLTVHHIVADGWSLGILASDLLALYRARGERVAARLPPLAVHYADYAVWQRTWLEGGARAQQLEYWTKRLSGSQTKIALPASRPRPAVETLSGALRPFALPGSLSDAVDRFSRERGVTPYVTLLAAFNALLHRQTGQTDLLVGSPVANRRLPEIEPLIGFFVNTLVIRTAVPHGSTFVDLVGRVRDAVWEALAHQDLPFEQVVEALAPDRDLARAPLFQVMFVLQNAPAPWGVVPDCVVTQRTTDPGTSKFDITLFVHRTDAGYGCVFEYNSDLFDAELVEGFARQYRELVRALVETPEIAIDVAPLAPLIDRDAIVRASAGPVRAYGEATPIPDLIAARARECPDGVALIWRSEQVTYRDLDARAASMAARLRGRGVRAETRVAVAMARSIDLVVAMLAVMKAGGAYVPVDPR